MLRPALLFLIALLVQAASGQTPAETHERIRSALESRNYLTAASELRDLEERDKASYLYNNYDYLDARVAEKIGDTARAMASHQSVVNRGSILKP